jgi:hypothetical protein
MDVPLSVLRLRRLAFDAGATRGGVHLAQQAVSKADCLLKISSH